MLNIFKNIWNETYEKRDMKKIIAKYVIAS